MIIEKARELGLAISESPEFVSMMEARKKVDGDPVISGMIGQYSDMQKNITEMLEASDIDAQAIRSMTAQMEEIQGTLLSTPEFVKAMETQNDFQQLMERVNAEIGACIGAPAQDEDAEHGCSGHCSSCGGCKH
ncbi:MAG: YlbF family regulator [Clostridia bacterium]|nr:YlbF family regulator [Clostridia bacterium]